MSSNTSASPEPAPKATSNKAPAKKPASKRKPASASHPSWKDIITECIAVNFKDSARSGVSRSAIKKYALETYKLDATYQLNRAIASGAESGLFVLPKGPSGKVKFPPKVKATVTEYTKPPSTKKAPAVAKPKPAPVKKTVAAKKAAKPAAKAAPKKVAVKKTAAPAKKAVAPAKKVVASAKKTVAPAKKATSVKRVEKKKVAAKAAATKRTRSR